MGRLSQFIAWLMLCAATSAFAAAPDSVQVGYDVYRNGMKIGEMEETYTRDNDRYTLSSVTAPTGLLAMLKPERIFMDSHGLIGKHGLRPLRFSQRRERDSGRNSHAEFNWESGQLTLVHHEQRTGIALPDGTQDRLSAMYQFLFLSLQPGTTLAFPMTNGRKLDDYHYAVSVGEKLKTPAGEFSTLYLDNQAKAGKNRTEIWLATQHDNLPCKMTITDSKGDQLTQVLTKLIFKPR